MAARRGRHLRPPRSGRSLTPLTRPPAAAGVAVEDRGRRPQLQGPRRGAEQAAAGRAAIFIKPSTAVDRPGDAIVLPDGSRTCRSRSRGRRRDRRARASRAARRTRIATCSASPASTTSPRASCRRRTCSTRAPRASTRSRPSGRASRPGSTTRATARRRGMGQRRAPAGVIDARADFSDRPSWSRSSRR